MEYNFEQELQKEQERTKKYILDNPYPTYEEINNKIKNEFHLIAEYGYQNHEYCKKIYDNPYNKDIIIEMGKKIYKRGGFQALQMNFHILKYSSPTIDSKDISIRCYWSNVEQYFKNVCNEWIA